MKTTIQIPEFRIRASAAHTLTTMPKSKGEILSQTVMSYLQLWFKEKLYNRKKEITSKYFEKGTTVESESIDFVRSFYNITEPYKKNETYFNDSFFTGTPDVILSNRIDDHKNAFDFDTFKLFETEPQKEYYIQGQVYMHLTKRKLFNIHNVLSDMPESMLKSIASKETYKNGTEYEYEFELATSKYTYLDVPDSLKIKTFEFSYDVNVINLLVEQVQKCRYYIKNTLVPQLPSSIQIEFINN